MTSTVPFLTCKRNAYTTDKKHENIFDQSRDSSIDYVASLSILFYW